MFPSKAFSMSELNLYQILQLNYYKKLQEWWTDEVDGGCISFNLYRNTECSIVLRRVLSNLSTMFLFRRVNSDWVVDQ